MKTASLLLSTLFVGTSMLAQEAPGGENPAPISPRKVVGGHELVAEGFAPSRASALANALENAVLQVHGELIQKGPNLKARMSLVRSGNEEHGVLEVDFLTRQLEGFVKPMERPRYTEVKDGYQVLVRCFVADYDPKMTERFVVQLHEVFKLGDQHCWVLINHSSGTSPETAQPSPVDGGELTTKLTNTGRIAISATGPGVQVTKGSDRREIPKDHKALVASHQVKVTWSPVFVQVTTHEPVLPGHPREQSLDGASMEVQIAVTDLVEQTIAVETKLNVWIPTATDTANTPASQKQLARAALTAAYDEVVQKVYFALRPPLVLDITKSDGDTPTWTVDVDLPYSLAEQFEKISKPELGIENAVGEATWERYCSAIRQPRDGRGYITKFRLGADATPDRIEAGKTRLGFTRASK